MLDAVIDDDTRLLAEAPLGHMPAYGTAHLSMLGLLLAASIVLARGARRADPARTDRVLTGAGWLLLANSVLWTAWGFMPWAWNIDESLPLHLSDALRFLLPLAMITRARWAIVVCWFWGLTLNMQSVLTPDLNYFVSVPLEFVQYWIAHGAGVVVPVVLVWGLRYHPTWRGYGLAYAATALWALLAFTVNLLVGTNYGYLNGAPAGPSLLDVMGPWPQYLLIEALAVAVVWALMTLPWVLLDRRAGTLADGPGGLVRRPRCEGPGGSPVGRRGTPTAAISRR